MAQMNLMSGRTSRVTLGFALGLVVLWPHGAWGATDKPAGVVVSARGEPVLREARLPAPSEEPLTPPASPGPPPATTGLALHASWNDRLVIESEDRRFCLQPIVILQSLFAFPINPAGDSVAGGRVYEGLGFSFRRSALGFDSRVLRHVRTFFLSNIANGTLTLWDFFTDLDFFDGQAVLRVGRFRPWLARQRLLAGDRYQMIQLPVAMTDLLEFGDGRDLGAGIFGLIAHKTIEYNLGVWNGEQRYSTEPTNGFLPSSNLRNRGNIDFELGSRLVFHPFGYLPAIDESDLDYSEKPKLSVGAAALFARRHDVRVPYSGYAYFDDRILKAGFEIDFRYRGFSLEAEGFLRKSWMLSTTDESGKTQYNTWGLGSLGKSAYVQSGYFVLSRLLEVTGRFDYVDVEPSKPGYILRPAAGINLFAHRYNLLLQLMYRSNMGFGFRDDANFKADMYFWRSLRPAERTDVYLGDGNRPMSRITHDIFVMMQASL